MLSIYTQAKTGNDKEGNYSDFVGILELYDKHQDRRASAVEISQALTSLGRQIETKLNKPLEQTRLFSSDRA